MIQTELYEGDVLLLETLAPYFSANTEVMLDERVYLVVSVQYIYIDDSKLWMQSVLLAKRPEGW